MVRPAALAVVLAPLLLMGCGRRTNPPDAVVEPREEKGQEKGTQEDLVAAMQKKEEAVVQEQHAEPQREQTQDADPQEQLVEPAQNKDSEHLFSCPTLDVKVLGFRWLDSVKTRVPESAGRGLKVTETATTAADGYRLIAFRCRFTLKGERTVLEEPAGELQLRYHDEEHKGLGAYVEWEMLGSKTAMAMVDLSADGCATMTPEVVFVVPEAATTKELSLDAHTGTPISVDCLRELGQEQESTEA